MQMYYFVLTNIQITLSFDIQKHLDKSGMRRGLLLAYNIVFDDRRSDIIMELV